MRLLLIRHGQTPSNLVGALDTAIPGPGLTPLGESQAAALPGALAGEGIGAVYASVQARAQLTAEPLAAELGLPVLVRDGLREIGAGELEMKHDKASIDLYHEISFGWADGRPERRMPGAENGYEVFDRFDGVVSEAVSGPADTAALVAHGQVIRTWVVGRTENVTVEFAKRNLLHNTGVVIVEGSSHDGWRTLSWMGQAVGGLLVDDGAATGPGGEPA